MADTPKKQLPTGIQTFEKIREGNYYYVDKTEKILELVKETAVFLSRPRRFGKSLTLSTIDALFSGKKELFAGLYAENNWDWETTYPVLRLSFANGECLTPETLNYAIDTNLSLLEKQFDCKETYHTISGRFAGIIRHIAEQAGKKVVVLVDEYDKPMLDNLTNTANPNMVETARETLRALYSVIKGSDEFIRFAMLTGVSKFSKVSLFSGLNNLTDITLEPTFSALCGYTQQELESVFAPELTDVDLEKLKVWYNGYNWTGESVYNPFDVLLFFRNKVYKPYWFETGTPTFLIEQLIHQQKLLYDFEKKIHTTGSLTGFNVGNFEPISLMFQSGYLTINQMFETDMGVSYTLKYPNKEVRQSLNELLFYRFVSDIDTAEETRFALYDCLNENDLSRLESIIQALYHGVPYDWYRNNTIAHYEGHWASMLYAFFSSIGLQVIAEDTTNKGRIDMTVNHKNQIYIFEFKVVEVLDENYQPKTKYPTGEAIKQLKEKQYADKYKALGKPIYLIGIEFSEASRDIVNFEVEQIQ